MRVNEIAGSSMNECAHAALDDPFALAEGHTDVSEVSQHCWKCSLNTEEMQHSHAT